jgi:hypothetical protein
MKSSTPGDGIDAARDAVKRYKALPAKEKKRLKDAGIDVSEILTIMFLQISSERQNAPRP